MGETKRIDIDTHSVVLEAPDLLVVTLRGPVLDDQVARYVRLRPSLLGGRDYLLILCDLHELTEVSLKSRRALAEIRDDRPQATALLGVSRRLRVVAEMVTTAGRLFGKRQPNLRFFDDEASARAWLREMGQRYRPARHDP